jgi:hypothetical protein
VPVPDKRLTNAENVLAALAAVTANNTVALELVAVIAVQMFAVLSIPLAVFATVQLVFAHADKVKSRENDGELKPSTEVNKSEVTPSPYRPYAGVWFAYSK